jgi:hypothetical protein
MSAIRKTGRIGEGNVAPAAGGAGSGVGRREDPGAGPAVAANGGQPTRVPLAHRTRQLGLNGRPASRPPCTNQFTNHMQKALSLFEKGPLALVAGAGLPFRSVSGRRVGLDRPAA